MKTKNTDITATDANNLQTASDNLSLNAMLDMNDNEIARLIKGTKHALSSKIHNEEDDQARRFVEALKPTNALECVLAMQITNLHTVQSNLAKDSHTIVNTESFCSFSSVISQAATTYVNSMTKLANATTNLVLTLHKMQTHQLQPTVGKVNVASGAQAVVGSVINNQKEKTGE